MARKRTLINKHAKKMFEKKCYFCGCDQYELLDVHRIAYESKDNKYTDMNTVILCSLCHRKVHSGLIKIFRKYMSTKGMVLHYIDENGIEHYK